MMPILRSKVHADAHRASDNLMPVLAPFTLLVIGNGIRRES